MSILPTSVSAAALALAACSVANGGEPTLPTATIRLSEWGLDSLAQVRAGRLSVIDDPAGTRLEVLALWRDQDLAVETASTSAVPAGEGECVVVDDMRGGGRNSLGGGWGVFQRAPSTAELAPATPPGSGLALRCRRQAEGFAGAWMQLYDPAARPRVYLDARPFASLVLWLRGDLDKVGLRLADERLDRQEESVAVPSLAKRAGADGWRQVSVPLDSLPSTLDRSRLASLALECSEGGVDLHVGAVALCRDSTTTPPPPAAAPTAAISAAPSRRGIWVWETAEILRSRKGMRRLQRFLAADKVTDLFLQLPTLASGSPALDAAPRNQRRLRTLVAALHAEGLRIHALDGHASYARRERRAEVLAGLAAVVEHNRAAAPRERFDAVHYDVEPYLLPGFGGPRQAEILHDYLELVVDLALAAHEAGLEVGFDLPFWFDSRDQDTGRDLEVELGGWRALPFEHVVDHADLVCLMDYRTAAWGADGIVAHAARELAYASDHGAKVMVGVETHPLPDERYLELAGEPLTAPPDGLAADAELVVTKESGGTARLALVTASRLDEMAPASPEAQTLYWPVRRSVPVPASRVSFAGSDAATLERVLGEAEASLRTYSAFAGFAIHHYGSYATLLTH